MNRPFALDAAEDYRIKVTLGITGWYCLRVQIDGSVRHLDVGSSYPGAGEGPKGMAVRHLKRYVSWVQTVEQLSAGSFELSVGRKAVVRFEPRGTLNMRQNV